MVSATLREDDDNISTRATTRSSRISFECHHSIIFEELDKQVDYFSDEESDDDEITSGSQQCRRQERLRHNDIDSIILDKGISAESHSSLNGSRRFFQRVASELSFCSALEDEIDLDPSRETPRHAGSILSVFKKRIIDREIKAGKIVLTPSMDVDAGRSRAFYSFRRKHHTTHKPCLSIEENTEMTRNCKASFHDDTPQSPKR